jgi:membrane protease YdiL (CAAX protease family)
MSLFDRENPWLADARRARRRWPAWLAALAAAAFSATILMAFKTWGGQLMDSLAADFRHMPGVWGDILAFGTVQCAIFGCFLVSAQVAVATEGRALWRRGRTGRLPALAIGLVIGAAGYAVTVGAADLAGAITPGPFNTFTLDAVLFGAALVAVQAVAEEAFFRGWLQPILCVSWGPLAGVTVTSVLFAGLHVIAGAHGVLAVANLFLGGVLFGLLALRTGNLFAASAAHFAWNWTESGVFGLSEQPTSSLLKFGFTGSPLWNGGADAMNGSLAMSLVLTSLVAGVLIALRVTARPS